MHIENARNLAHDFSVKLSPCMCSYVRLTWLDTYIYLWWLYLYMYLLAQARPMMTNLTSYIKVKVLLNLDDGSIHL